MSDNKISIAIDGPSVAGKSTIARCLAKNLGYIYVDTGALYRAVGLAALRKGVDTTDSMRIGEVLEGLNIRIAYQEGEQRIFIDTEDVSDAIRMPEMSMAASNVSAFAEVRAFLLEAQRRMARENNLVMDGRDIGTVVLPDANIKIFLTATVEERAKRRYNEFVQKGIAVDFDTLLAETQQRDFNDTNRAHAPLRQAADARLIDSTSMTLDQVVAQIQAIVEERM